MDDEAAIGGARVRGAARRVRMPSSGLGSWTVVGAVGGLVEPVDEFLG